MKNSVFSLLTVGILSLSAQQAFADCSTGTISAILGPVNSFNIGSLSNLGTAPMVGGGLSCPSGLTLVVKSYIKYLATNIPTELVHSDGVNKAQISIWDSEKQRVTSAEKDLSSIAITTLFSGPGGSVPFYVTVNDTRGLKPGVYRGRINIKWFYSVPYAGGLGITLRYESTGFELGSYLIGTYVKNWGTGDDSIINITLTVEEDCNINAQNINFGTAPLVSKFNPVTGTVQITCSAQTPYTVGLSNGQNYSQNRRMKNLSSNHYLPYEIYKNTTTQRWGYLGAERWSSANASQNPGVYDGSVTQGYAYTAKIIDDGSNASVEGTYKDSLILEVAF